MSTVHEQPQIVNTREPSNRHLDQLASDLANDQGSPGMGADEIELMLAHIVGLPEILDRTKDDLREDMFLPNERQLWLLFHSAAVYANENRVAPSSDSLRAAIRRQLEGNGCGADGDAGLLQEMVAEAGLLDRIAGHSANCLSVDQGRALVHNFLTERGVVRPIVTIATAPAKVLSWTEHGRLPTSMISILQQAAERLDKINTEWGAAEEWAPPESLDGPELPVFPVHVLPESLRNWVQAEATATQTPVDLGAMLSLASVSTAGAKRIEIQVRDGWVEPINIYVLTVLGPGNRKSAVYADATAPLRLFERRAIERRLPAVQQYQRQVRVLEASIKRLEKRAAEIPERREELLRQVEAEQRHLDGLNRVVEPRLIADDCTPEMLETIIAGQGGRIAVLSAEGGGPLAMMRGRYGDEPKFEVFLKGHAGDELRTDRVSRTSVFVDRPAITLGLCVQPDVIRGLGQKTMLRGQGLLSRFLFALPPSPIGRRDMNPLTVPESVSTGYRRIVEEVCRLVRVGEPASLATANRLQFTDEAREPFDQFREALEHRMAECGDLAAFRDWASKLPGAVARIAGILHLAEQAQAHQDQATRGQHHRDRAGIRQARPSFTPWETPMSATTVSAAVTIAEYLIPHALAAFVMMDMAVGPGAQVVADAWHAVRWIRERGQNSFTRSELQQQNRGRFRRAADVDPALDLLENRNIIRPMSAARPGPRGGRTASQRFAVNPQVLAAEYSYLNPASSAGIPPDGESYVAR